MIGCGGAGRIAWWRCRPSLGRALLCGGAAIYLGTFIGADAVTMFCAAQGVRLLVRALGRRRLRFRRRLLATDDRAEPSGAIAGEWEAGGRQHDQEAVKADPELTVAELIAGDPGPEPGDPGPELEELAAPPDLTGGDGAGGEAVRIGPWVDGHVLAISPSGHVLSAAKDASEARRLGLVGAG